MEVLNISSEEVKDVLRLLAGILQLGNMEFVTAGGAQIASKQVLSNTSELLGLESSQLAEVLTQRSMILRGEEISIPLTTEQAEDSRNSMAMALYAQCFSWIIGKINCCIKGKENFKSIGILDIFGFENFQVNRFEQFNINYANEKLQEYFNKHIFSLEQLEYNREGISWEAIDWMDNAECLDLVEKKLGMLALINEESRFPKGTDLTLLEKLHMQHATNQFYVKLKVTHQHFGIKHYAGEVQYSVEGFLEKNRDTFRDDLLSLLKESGIDFIYDLFEHVTSRSGDKRMKSGGKQQRKATVSTQFKDSLHSLMATLSLSNPFFVRCIKPNSEKIPSCFEPSVVLNQLRYSGMLETVRIRRAGFPVRRPFADFVSRYKVLMEIGGDSEDVREHCAAFLHTVDADAVSWKLGKTKVFLRESLESELEKKRVIQLHKAATTIRAHVLAFLLREQEHKVIVCAIAIQTRFRGQVKRRIFLRQRTAALTLQKYWRGLMARQIYHKLLEEKRREEEERKRQEEEERRQREEAERRQREEERKWREEEEARRLEVDRERERLEAELKTLKEQGEERRRQAEETGNVGAVQEDEATQLILIEKLEKEIELLQQQREAEDQITQQISIEGQSAEAWEAREEAIRRLEEEADQATQDFLETLDFGECETCESHVQQSLSDVDELGQNKPFAETTTAEKVLGKKEQMVDEEDEGFAGGEERNRVLQQGPHVDQHPLKGQINGELNEEQKTGAGEKFTEGGEEIDEPIYDAPILEEFDLEFDESGSFIDSEGTISIRQRHDKRQFPSEYDSRYSYNGSIGQSTIGESNEDFNAGFDEDDDTTFRRDGIHSVAGIPYFNSFLFVKGGRMNIWKKRWCVLKNETFLWFRAKQEALKAGWLNKKGGGTSTLSRRNWKRRWFVLRGEKLMYFDTDGEDKLKGSINIREAREIVDNVDKENSIDIVTQDRTYLLVAESPEDASDWFNVLSRVNGASDQELREMHDEQANPNNAMGTIDVGMIDSVCASDNPDRPNSFVIITANRVLHCTADTAEEMQHWISVLQFNKGDVSVEGQVFVVRGWLCKELKNSGKGTMKSSNVLRLKKRWFVLTHVSLDYYKSSERGAPKLGSLVVNSLCSVVQPDEKNFRDTGYCGFIVHGQKHSYHLYTKLQNEVTYWASTIQMVIDSKLPIETPTQNLIADIRELDCNSKEVEQIYRRNPILRYTQHPLRSPLMPLPYGDVGLHGHRVRTYTSLRNEALHIFEIIQTLDTATDYISTFHDVLQSCHDLQPLQDEVYCQLVKQTIGVPRAAEDSVMRCWQLLACMSCTFLPGRGVLRYLSFHLKRMKERHASSEIGRCIPSIMETLKKTKNRDFVPSTKEMKAIIKQEEMSITVYCYGDSSCHITIDSHTTAREVVDKLMRGLGIEGSLNRFALFEHQGEDTSSNRAIEARTVVADLLSKFERLTQSEQVQDDNCWKLYFKLYCFLDTRNVPPNSLEFAFMFEQAHECLVHGRFPAPEETLQQLAALRLQSSLGDHVKHVTVPDPPGLAALYPVERLRARVSAVTRCTSGGANPSCGTPTGLPTSSSERRLTGFLEGTLRRTLRVGVSNRGHAELTELWVREEIQASRSGILDKWRQLRNVSQEQAMIHYMDIMREWQGFGSTLFDVKCKEGGFPQELWLAVGAENVAVHKRGDARALETFTYEHILSFGASQCKTYHIALDGREMVFETAQEAEIAKLMKAYANNVVTKRDKHLSTGSQRNTKKTAIGLTSCN
uniref:unconventional myosin-X-like n=1 Tax=Myxine glutinosa TaxID=7769 RepID=UPI00358E019B